MKKLLTLVLSAALTLCLLLSFTDTAYAGDLDLVRQYDVTVTPNAEDGSLEIEVAFQWEVLEQGPVIWLQIGIPNGSIRDVEPLTDNIADLSYDNSYMYVYFTRGYNDGEVIEFSYRWTQEYMYGLDGSQVLFDYTPGWFEEARIEEMTVTWNTPQELSSPAFTVFTTDGQWEEYNEDSAAVYTARDLDHGAQINVTAIYSGWPTELFWENSRDNQPQDDFYYDDDYYYPDYPYYEDDSDALWAFFVILLIVLYIVIRILLTADGYAGGFGTRYVLYHGLWYPAGRDGRTRPGSVGTHKKPQPPRSSGGGGFGGGSRGGFGGGGRGGFGGGGHCACASSCACACACACAGGGRAGCSAKNLYGSVQLSKKLTAQLEQQ